MTMRRSWLAACLIAVFTVAACGGNQSQTPDQGSAAPGSTVQINGAGATFPNPIYSKWFSEYNKVHPNIQINYQPIGSGGGIRQLTSQTVFFGASDGPMTDEQLKAAPGPILHFPTVLGAVVPVFNLAGVTDDYAFDVPLAIDQHTDLTAYLVRDFSQLACKLLRDNFSGRDAALVHLFQALQLIGLQPQCLAFNLWNN